jgi:hypothetical protein
MSNRKPRTRQPHEGAVRIDRPTPGLYKTRLWPTTPGERVAWGPAMIWEEPARDPITHERLDRRPAMLCMINGFEADPYTAYLHLHPCSSDEYERLCRRHDGACERVVSAMMENLTKC